MKENNDKKRSVEDNLKYIIVSGFVLCILGFVMVLMRSNFFATLIVATISFVLGVLVLLKKVKVQGIVIICISFFILLISITIS